jgi:sulfur-oxidizing protein SoxA
MRSAAHRIAALCLAVTLSLTARADPEQDREAFRAYFLKRFPDVPVEEYVNGIYAIDQEARAQWQDIEAFPPYEFAVEEGEALFGQPFANGRGYADCFENGGVAIRQLYPRFDLQRGEVVTLELALNHCRTDNGEQAYPYQSDQLVALSAFMAWTSRGQAIAVEIPDDPRALAAYEDGKRFYYSKRGQLNFACSDCGGRLGTRGPPERQPRAPQPLSGLPLQAGQDDQPAQSLLRLCARCGRATVR